ARSELAETYEDLGVLVVVSAGLFDGLNPCAFTVIIFFLSYLAYIGKEKREIAAVGIVFTTAVFVTYFAIGLALVGLAVSANEQQLLRESLTELAARRAREAAQPPAAVRAERSDWRSPSARAWA
ncbi:MAG: hypothetical protein ACYS8L_11280, partial [Planctomycetota bacterium]